MGAEHPDTAISAWNLFQTLLASGNVAAAQGVLAENLLWLLEADPATLAGSQQKIRQMLSEMLASSAGA